MTMYSQLETTVEEAAIHSLKVLSKNSPPAMIPELSLQKILPLIHISFSFWMKKKQCSKDPSTIQTEHTKNNTSILWN